LVTLVTWLPILYKKKIFKKFLFLLLIKSYLHKKAEKQKLPLTKNGPLIGLLL
jgi:hypothetical protein